MTDFGKTSVLAFYNSFLKTELNCGKESMIVLISAVFKRKCCLN